MTNVTMVFPRAVNLTVLGGDGKRKMLKFTAGVNEVPEEHAAHRYLEANGVKKYDHKAVAKKAREDADAAAKKADEAAAKAKGKGAAPAPAAAPATTDNDPALVPSDMTIADLQAELTKREIEFDKKAKKDDLVELLEGALEG